MGENSKSHYASIGVRDAWDTTPPKTIRKYIDALVAGGIPEDRFDEPQRDLIIRDRGSIERDDLTRASLIARDIAEDNVYSYEIALVKAIEVRLVDGNDLAWRRATLTALNAEHNAEKLVGRAPVKKHPKKPPKVGVRRS